MWTSLASVVILFSLSAADPTVLSDKSQQEYQKIIENEFCSCRSALTVSGCQKTRPQCRTAEHLANATIRGLQRGYSPSELSVFLANNVLGDFCKKTKVLQNKEAPSIGSGDALLRIVEFADYRCPHCKREAPKIEAARKAYASKVQFVFFPFPLQNTEEGLLAAEAALEANAQGKFEAMNRLLFAHQDTYTQKSLIGLAKKAGLRMESFRKALSTHEHRPTVLRLKAFGETQGINKTPTVFVNGKLFKETQGMFELKDRIRMEIEHNEGACQ